MDIIGIEKQRLEVISKALRVTDACNYLIQLNGINILGTSSAYAPNGFADPSFALDGCDLSTN